MHVRSIAVALLSVVAVTVAAQSAQNPRNQVAVGPETFTRRVVATGLDNPWEVTWGPDGYLWVTERTAFRVSRVDPANGTRRVALTLDNVFQSVVQDGLLGMALHPDLLRSRGRDFVYLAYTYDADPGPALRSRLRVRRYTYDQSTQTLGSPALVLEDLPAHDDHGGGRLVVGPDGKLYLSRGDQGGNWLANYCREIRSQDLPDSRAVAARDWSSYQGKILRMELDGTIPADNPVIEGVRSHIYAYGFRNPQGLSFGANGRLYASEHGPSTDDEVDLVQPGKNYGWPHVAGANDDQAYAFANWSRSSPAACSSLTFSSQKPAASVPIAKESAWSHRDFVPPLATLFTVPTGYDFTALGTATIAPGSIEVYAFDAIPGWRSSLLVTGMRTGAVYRLTLNADGTAVAGAPLEYFRRPNRYRDTAVSVDGRRIFVATDSFGAVSDERGQRTDALAEPGAILEFTFTPAGR